jgi:hypothetical protein
MSNEMSSLSVNTRAAIRKRLLVMTAIAAMIASPAFAQSARQLAIQERAAAAAFAAQTRSPSLNEVYRNSVYSNWEYVGADRMPRFVSTCCSMHRTGQVARTNCHACRLAMEGPGLAGAFDLGQ